MIVVLGRPALPGTLRPSVGADDADTRGLAGRAAQIALESARLGAHVELVGSVGDDPEGDEVIVRLGRGGVGHAALLRDPTARTPVGEVHLDAPSNTGHDAADAALSRHLPRLEPADISLGLSYVADCRVLVIAERLPSDAQRVAAEAAAYHGAAVVAIVEHGTDLDAGLADDATLLEAPRREMPDEAGFDAPVPGEEATDGDATVRSDAFNRLVAAYAVALDRGEDPAVAFHAASDSLGWESLPT